MKKRNFIQLCLTNSYLVACYTYPLRLWIRQKFHSRIPIPIFEHIRKTPFGLRI